MTQYDPYRTPDAPVGMHARVPLATIDCIALAAVLLQCVATLGGVGSMLAMLREGLLSVLVTPVFWLATLVLLLAGVLLFRRNRAAPWLFLVALVLGGLPLLPARLPMWLSMSWPVWLLYSGIAAALLGAIAGFLRARPGGR